MSEASDAHAQNQLTAFCVAMVEYSLDLQIPEYVWDDPILQEMSKAVIDIMTWPNVSCLARLLCFLSSRNLNRIFALSMCVTLSVVAVLLL